MTIDAPNDDPGAAPRAVASGSRPFGSSHLMLVLLGVGLLSAVAWVVWAPAIGWVWYGVALKLLLAAAVGLLLRGLRRRVYFGRRLTLHQSLSFEVVAQIAHWSSPLLPRRAFEAEFIACETGVPPRLAAAWLKSRSAGLGFTALLALAALSLVLGAGVPALLLGVLALGWLGYALRDLLRDGAAGAADAGIVRLLGSMLVGAGIWLVEGALFVWAVSGLLTPAQAVPLYLLATALLEVVPVPYGIGVAESPALIGVVGGYGVAAFGVLLLFHLARLLPLLPLGVIYLARYKLLLADLQTRDLIARLAERRRPAGGWREAAPTPAAGPEVSIVIPAFNEEQRLPGYLDDVRAYLDGEGPDAEVLVVDDGSSDGTAAYVRDVAAVDSRVRLVAQPSNQGKGNAVRRGVMEAQGHYVLFTDADGATPIAELDKLLAAVGPNAEIAIGSRRIASDEASRERAGLRELMGQVFYSVVNFFAVPGIRDTQCGFKLFRADVARDLFADLNEAGWAFDVELLYRAQLHGYGIAEVPVNWHEVEGSKVNPVKDAIKMFVAIFRIRQNNSGLLRAPAAAVVGGLGPRLAAGGDGDGR